MDATEWASHNNTVFDSNNNFIATSNMTHKGAEVCTLLPGGVKWSGANAATALLDGSVTSDKQFVMFEVEVSNLKLMTKNNPSTSAPEYGSHAHVTVKTSTVDMGMGDIGGTGTAANGYPEAYGNPKIFEKFHTPITNDATKHWSRDPNNSYNSFLPIEDIGLGPHRRGLGFWFTVVNASTGAAAHNLMAVIISSTVEAIYDHDAEY